MKTLTTKKNCFEFREINYIKVIKFLVKNLSKENVLERKTFRIKRPLRWSLRLIVCLSVSQAARKLAITEVDLERAEARLEAAEA